MIIDMRIKFKLAGRVMKMLTGRVADVITSICAQVKRHTAHRLPARLGCAERDQPSAMF